MAVANETGGPMLLPFECLAYRIADGRLLPCWLGEADEPFVSAVLESVAGFAGLQVGDAEIVAPAALASAARASRMPVRIAEAIWAIERRRWETKVDAPVDPEALRDVVFELAVRLPRDEALAEAGRRLGIASEVVAGSLFADRQIRRILVAPDERSRPADVVARYNLALAQALLARSMEVQASIRGDATAIVAAAKRDGLLARFEVADEGTRLTLAGPLALFHDTAKYGRMLARFVPSLVAASSWSLRARVTLGPQSAELALDHHGAIAFPSTLPAAPDGRLARRVARMLRAAGVQVDLHPAVVRAGTALVVPDFALELPGGRVLVDVVPFSTPEYLDGKLSAIEEVGAPMLVCVDARYVSAASRFVVPYRDEIDPFALYAAALRLLDEPVTASCGPSPSSSRTPSSPLGASPDGAPASPPLPSPARGASAPPRSWRAPTRSAPAVEATRTRA